MGKILKKHKKKFIFGGVVLVVLLIVLGRVNRQVKQLPTVTVSRLEEGNLANVVNLTGTIESQNSKKVYTSLSLPVDTNMVEVGDRVKVGDVLCVLDTKSLENTVAQQQATAGSQAAIYQNSIALSQKQYEQALADLEEEHNTAIFQAEQSLIQAEQALEKAELALDSSVDDVQYARGKKVNSFGEVYPDGDEDRDKKYGITQASNARDIAYANYESAKQGVLDAEEALALTKYQAEQQIDGLKDSIQTNEIAAGSVNATWVAINQLQEDIKDGTVTSPVDGVITAVYVTEGAPSTGLLYVIEDVDDLKVVANLKEYDLSLVAEGNPVEIKSDATGDEIFSGKLTRIAPTTTKTPTGDNVTGVSGEFETEIAVDSKQPGLRVGTKARMDIVYEEKSGVMNVSYEAIGQKEQAGELISVLYTLKEEVSGSGIYQLQGVPVELGMETDFTVEIISDELKPGDYVLADATGLKEGDRVQLPDGMQLEAYTAGLVVDAPLAENQEG